MGLADVAGVLSRYFIVGFFLPSFFVLVALSQTVDDGFLPEVYREAGSGGQIAILGGTALLLGLVLSGLHYEVLRFYEGYPLRDHGDRWYAKRLFKRLDNRQKADFAELNRKSANDGTAKWRLDQTFPWDDESLLLPTRFGNAVRAFERHPRTRWGLNSIAAWPHVEMLLSTDEISVHTDARGDLAFFLNGSLLATIAGLVLAGDAIAHTSVSAAVAALVAFGLARIFYKWAVGAAIRWGSAVRASMDIHRREVYEKLGVRKPASFSDERDTVGPAVNRTLLRGDELPDALAAPAAAGPEKQEGAALSFGGMTLRLEENRKQNEEQA